MQITRSSSAETTPGPGEWFTGRVYVDTVASPTEPSRLGAASVLFTPGARTAWHTHPLGQTIYLTEGIGLCQRRGGEIEVIRPGDHVFFEPGEDHWHGAGPLHDSHRDAGGRRLWQPRRLGRARHRRGVRRHPSIMSSERCGTAHADFQELRKREVLKNTYSTHLGE